MSMCVLNKAKGKDVTMKDRIKKLLICLIILFLLNIVIFLTPLDNSLIYSISYFTISIYFIFNVCTNAVKKKRLVIYGLYILTFIIFNAFLFSIINILMSLSIILLIIYEIKRKNKKVKKSEPKPAEQVPDKKEIVINVQLPLDFDIEEFEHIAKKLYIDMQTYFMNLEYTKLELILDEKLYQQFSTQMNLLEKNKKCAVRDNIEFIDFKINDFERKSNNELTINTSIGVIENKYTRSSDSNSKKNNCRYESYYEIIYIKKEDWSIHSLKLIYSHSNRNG